MTSSPVAVRCLVFGLLLEINGWSSMCELASARERTERPASERQRDRPSDRELRRMILERLQNHDRLGEREIAVDVKDGRVTLRGIVDSAFEKTHAYFLATVPGVTDIDNRLAINDDDHPDDETLRTGIEHAFQRDPRIAGTELRIDVKQGVVTLTGLVNSGEAKQAATDLARQFAGVKRVKNHLEVRHDDPSVRESRDRRD